MKTLSVRAQQKLDAQRIDGRHKQPLQHVRIYLHYATLGHSSLPHDAGNPRQSFTWDAFFGQ
jgi:hypothetical protein